LGKGHPGVNHIGQMNDTNQTIIYPFFLLSCFVHPIHSLYQLMMVLDEPSSFLLCSSDFQTCAVEGARRQRLGLSQKGSLITTIILHA
jgi:hypothetical protein